MDFFSKLKSKASKTYQVTKEKAANISEELKLKGKIIDLKDKISNLYTEIGKTVYNELKDGRDVSKEEITEKCDEISKYKDEIERIQSNILALKKVMKCANCGEELDIGDTFCYKCGNKQPEVEKVEIKNDDEQVVKDAEVVEIAETEENNNNEESNNN